MKTVPGTFALTVLVVGLSLTTVQAGTAPDGTQLLLVESGSDRLIDYHTQRRSQSDRPGQEEFAERYIRMIKEQPTAAGDMPEELAPQDRMDRPEPMHKSPIQRDRQLYGK
ncbi:hypothetical protein NGA35_06945 [Pseudomonas stutzeri]|nr:hypothetical protein [Stutzerimonas stutzeri]